MIYTLYTMYSSLVLGEFSDGAIRAHFRRTPGAHDRQQQFVPYYMQIVDHVRELIKKNKLSQGQTFCSEGEIAQALKISKMPVRQAFQKLRSEGLLMIAKGKRPVIGSGRVPWNFQRLRGFREMRRQALILQPACSASVSRP